MSWHVDDAALYAYAADRVEEPLAFSIEAHLLSCGRCRSSLSRFVDGTRLERMWGAVDERIVTPDSGVIERTLTRAGVPDYLTRLLMATPSLRRSWFLAVAAVLALAAGASHGSNGGSVLFLLVAPLLPVAGIAAAYGPGVDPAYEIGIASPLHSFKLLLIRAAAVLTTTTAMACVTALLLPGLDSSVAAWMLPSLGLTVSSLTLSTIVKPLFAAGMVAAAWMFTVAAAASLAPGTGNLDAKLQSVFGDLMQGLFAGVIVVAGFLLLMRRDEFERGERQ